MTWDRSVAGGAHWRALTVSFHRLSVFPLKAQCRPPLSIGRYVATP
jgi:hypothetical protein